MVSSSECLLTEDVSRGISLKVGDAGLRRFWVPALRSNAARCSASGTREERVDQQTRAPDAAQRFFGGALHPGPMSPQWDYRYPAAALAGGTLIASLP